MSLSPLFCTVALLIPYCDAGVMSSGLRHSQHFTSVCSNPGENTTVATGDHLKDSSSIAVHSCKSSFLGESVVFEKIVERLPPKESRDYSAAPGQHSETSYSFWSSPHSGSITTSLSVTLVVHSLRNQFRLLHAWWHRGVLGSTLLGRLEQIVHIP